MISYIRNHKNIYKHKEIWFMLMEKSLKSMN